MSKSILIGFVALSVFPIAALAQRVAGRDAPPKPAQLAVRERPVATDLARLPLAAALPSARAADAERLQELTDWNAGGNLPRRTGIKRPFAVPVQVELPVAWSMGDGVRLVDDGELRVDGNGALWWSAQFEVEDAAELRLHLAGVRLPDSAEVWTTGDDGVPRGPLRASWTTQSRELWCPTVEGERVSVQVKIPAGSDLEGAGFTVAGVLEKFALTPEGAPRTGRFSPIANATSCLLDATCNGPVVQHARAIAMLDFVDPTGSVQCTGGLLMNTNLDFQPYLLTAEHCGLGNGDVASTLELRWDYRTPTCNGATSSFIGPTHGATHLRSGTASDFTLLLLDSLPDANRRWLGWDATPSILLDDLFMWRIAHPDGLPQKFSTSRLDLTPAFACPGRTFPGFLSSVPESGETRDGSSGAPVLARSDDVIGQHRGRCTIPNAGCDYSSFNVLDGAFAATFNSVCEWLDPNGLAAITEPLINAPSVAASGANYELTWTDTTPEHVYELQESLSATFTNPTTRTLSAPRYSPLNHVVTVDTFYYYRVRARHRCPATNVTHFSSWSSTKWVHVLAQCPGSLSAPVLTMHPSAVPSGVPYQAVWTSTSPENLYEVQESISPAFTSAVTSSVGGTSKTFAHAVSAVTTYYYRVRAMQTCTASYSHPYSATASITVYPGTSVPLTTGVPVQRNGDSGGGFRHYSVLVPSGARNLRFTSSGGTGDANLYVKFGAPASTTSFDYRPLLGGNNESVLIAQPGAGTWYAGLHAPSSYAGVDILASFELPGTPSDFDGNARSEVLWRHSNGWFAMWEMNGRTLLNGAGFHTHGDANWRILGTGDFNGDGRDDIFLRHAVTGATAMWLMNGRTFIANGVSTPVPDMNWQMHAIGDFHGDRKDELIWRHAITGDVAMWEMNGTTLLNGAVFYRVADLQWQIVLAADFNGDGKDELLWRHSQSNAMAMWDLQGRTLLNAAVFATVSDAKWQIVATGRFNAGRTADILWQHSATGTVAMWEMSHRTITNNGALLVISDPNWQVERGVDFHGDGKDEILWRNKSSGELALWEVNGHTLLDTRVFTTVADPGWKIQPRGGVRPALNSQ